MVYNLKMAPPYSVSFSIVMAVIPQKLSSNIEFMNDMVDPYEIAMAIDPYRPYKRFDGGSARGQGASLMNLASFFIF